MLFLAVEWERKGGDIAVEAARRLNEDGIPTTLVVVGCTPPADQIEPFVDCRGFVDKRTEAGREELSRLLAESHVLIHPARAEAYGLALTEASAFGLPVVAAGVGGITTIVHDGRNGHALAAGSSPAAYAAAVSRIVEDRERMLGFARSSRAEYDARLNWEVAGGAVADRLARLAR
jgi:glycosyltransferase involved in cell wall biosynthesis